MNAGRRSRSGALADLAVMDDITRETAEGPDELDQAYRRFLEAGCLPARARLHVRLRGEQ